MELNKKSAVYLLLVLFVTQVGELVIPHYHVEKENIVLPDFSNNGDRDKTHDDDGETLHSKFYQWSDFEYSLNHLQTTTIVWQINNNKGLLKSFYLSNYNILPKVLNSQLFVIHICSSKSPPFLV